MQISGRIINARRSSLNVLDMRINLIKISLRNIGNFCAFGAPTIAVIPVWVHKIGKKTMETYICDNCFFVPSSSSIRFCIAAMVA